ncbi:CD225/dispanin family protein [Mucilaginibacter sp. JRF]|uniref:CD225/dispanin family protein n=1 Tax=Mucilaginibacter sp. JRF TaxID=2780088 RepID=UPI00187DF5EE|nr:CD225/dispanin family protein [Mucilaginibacter sp. JRF]MBE9586711.1 CD225/dispanin family protein [Mucilaginibacter sp. JRF]
MEPTSPFGQTPGIRPKNWLVESILVTIFCCIPFGIVAIVNAASVNNRFDVGDYVGAENASKQAGKWTKITFWIGIGFWVIYFILFALGIGGALLSRP